MGGLRLFRIKKSYPRDSGGKNQGFILILFALSVLFFILARIIPSKKADALSEEMTRASAVMVKAIDSLRQCQKNLGILSDKRRDINQTGLIGLEFSSITTSVGNLEAKRTTTNPNFAGLVVFLLKEAGVRNGDTIAVGASGSFPALIVAVLSAAKVMDVKPLMIYSLGASQWGANNPDFHLLRMLNCLWESGTFDTKPIALSIGGEADTGKNLQDEGCELIRKAIEESRIPFINETDLEQNVRERFRLYKEKAGKDEIRVFVNIGGNSTNIGEDSSILDLKPGIVRIRHLPAPEKRGVLHEMASHKIPVIHFLYIKGLVQRYGLTWDPVPLSRPGDEEIYIYVGQRQKVFLFLVSLYFILFSIVLCFYYRLKLKS